MLSAQAAQLAGDRDAADRAFRIMASRADTKALGLHGLFVEAHRRNDHVRIGPPTLTPNSFTVERGLRAMFPGVSLA